VNGPRLDLSRARRLHVVGVAGAGMGAMAEVLAAMGHRVSGTDLAVSPELDRLAGLGVEVAVGHHPELVEGVEAVAASTAVPATDPEVAAARRRGIPVLRRADLLAAMCGRRRTVAVSGTHGKTTTSAMLSASLAAAGMQPSFVVGGRVLDVGSGGRWDSGEWLVVEADESDGTFLELPAEAVVVTSVEPDHLEHYGSFDNLVSAFGRFLAAAPGVRVVCADDPVAAEVGAARGAVTYGTSHEADYRLVDVERGRAGVTFGLEHAGEVLGRVRVPLPGLHNARNAAAAVVAATALGAPFDAAAAGVARSGGVARRFHRRGERDGVTFVDDYAHLPGEVAAALSAATDGGWDRVVAVFQPHRYSRTQALATDFAGAFVGADLVVVTDVYAAGEPPRRGVTGRLVADAVTTGPGAPPVSYVPDRAGLVSYLRSVLRAGDLCLTLGAGDLTTLADELLAGA
jgi:UDP-N-acetylmuramate--alanine ligase